MNITCDHCGEDIIQDGVVLWTRGGIAPSVNIYIVHESCVAEKTKVLYQST